MNNSLQAEKVSVIIPTYNRAKFLAAAVNSIINQKYENIEIIFVDDGSKDDTQVVVKSLQQKYSNIIYCKNERSKGPSGARNTGILKASGVFLTFLDSDDVWLEGHLENGLEVFNRHPEINVLFGNFNVEDYQTGLHKYDFFSQKKIVHTLKGIQISADTKILHDNLFKALLQENFFHLSSVIINKSALNGILLDEAITYAEDRDFAIQLYKKNNATFAYRNDPVFILYTHDSSLCSTSTDSTQPILSSHIYLFKKYLADFSLSTEEQKMIKKLLAIKMSSTAYFYSRKKDYNCAFSSIIMSFKYRFTITQIKDLMKVLMTFIIAPKTKYI